MVYNYRRLGRNTNSVVIYKKLYHFTGVPIDTKRFSHPPHPTEYYPQSTAAYSSTGSRRFCTAFGGSGKWKDDRAGGASWIHDKVLLGIPGGNSDADLYRGGDKGYGGAFPVSLWQ